MKVSYDLPDTLVDGSGYFIDPDDSQPLVDQGDGAGSGISRQQKICTQAHRGVF